MTMPYKPSPIAAAWLAMLVATVASADPATSISPPPASIADAHLHCKWNQAEVTSPEEAVAAIAHDIPA